MKHVLEATYSSSATHHGQKNRGRVRGYFSLIINMVYAFANKNKYDSLFSISTLTSALTPFFNGFLDAREALTRFFLTNSANSKSEAEFFYVGVFVKELNTPQGPSSIT
ncbi:hypothetical protein [Corynebacterium durum]|uniref:hypothetical protein n=1 Tax=Corynebacterium durum TaxID=61592 RepID=UPI0028F11E2F|nr:hypothetical protein [Corynebacterium durum]